MDTQTAMSMLHLPSWLVIGEIALDNGGDAIVSALLQKMAEPVCGTVRTHVADNKRDPKAVRYNKIGKDLHCKRMGKHMGKGGFEEKGKGDYIEWNSPKWRIQDFYAKKMRYNPDLDPDDAYPQRWNEDVEEWVDEDWSDPNTDGTYENMRYVQYELEDRLVDLKERKAHVESEIRMLECEIQHDQDQREKIWKVITQLRECASSYRVNCAHDDLLIERDLLQKEIDKDQASICDYRKAIGYLKNEIKDALFALETVHPNYGLNTLQIPVSIVAWANATYKKTHKGKQYVSED